MDDDSLKKPRNMYISKYSRFRDAAGLASVFAVLAESILSLKSLHALAVLPLFEIVPFLVAIVGFVAGLSVGRNSNSSESDQKELDK